MFTLAQHWQIWAFLSMAALCLCIWTVYPNLLNKMWFKIVIVVLTVAAVISCAVDRKSTQAPSVLVMDTNKPQQTSSNHISTPAVIAVSITNNLPPVSTTETVTSNDLRDAVVGKVNNNNILMHAENGGDNSSAPQINNSGMNYGNQASQINPVNSPITQTQITNVRVKKPASGWPK